MLGLRVVLGVLEAGLYPSIVYLLATWYSRCEWPTVISITSGWQIDETTQMMLGSGTQLST